MTHELPKRAARALSGIAIALCLYSLPVGAQDTRMQEADLVLLGTVVSKGRSANAETAATPSTAVVRVEQIVKPATPGSPTRRCPDITLARSALDWEPRTPLEVGLKHTIDYFDELLRRE